MITVDTSAIKDVEKRLKKHADMAPVAISRSLNRAASKAGAEIGRMTAEKYEVKRAKVKGTIKVRGASKSMLGATITSRDASLPLNYFKFTPGTPQYGPKRGKVKVTVRKGQQKLLRKGFALDLNGTKLFKHKDGSKHVKHDDRMSVKTKKYIWSQLPVRKLFGPSIPGMVGNKEIRKEIEQIVDKTYSKELDRQIKLLQEGK